MSQQDLQPTVESFERWLDASAQSFCYPQTPNLAAKLRQHPTTRPQSTNRPRRLVWVAAAIAVAALLLTISPVRTAMMEIMSRTPIRIFLLEPYQATLTPTVTATLPAVGGLSGSPFLKRQPTPAARPITAVLEMIEIRPSAAGGAYLFRATD